MTNELNPSQDGNRKAAKFDGWAKPATARLFHRFVRGAALCSGPWRISSGYEMETENSRGYCGECCVLDKKLLDDQIDAHAQKTFDAIEAARAKMTPEERQKADKEADLILGAKR